MSIEHAIIPSFTLWPCNTLVQYPCAQHVCVPRSHISRLLPSTIAVSECSLCLQQAGLPLPHCSMCGGDIVHHTVLSLFLPRVTDTLIVRSAVGRGLSCRFCYISDGRTCARRTIVFSCLRKWQRSAADRPGERFPCQVKIIPRFGIHDRHVWFTWTLVGSLLV